MLFYVLLECWNDVLEPWKESPWVRTTCVFFKVTVHDRIKEISFCWNVGTTTLGALKEQTSGDGGVPGPRLPKASQAGSFQHSNKRMYVFIPPDRKTIQGFPIRVLCQTNMMDSHSWMLHETSCQ
jgi:hypothetical protein